MNDNPLHLRHVMLHLFHKGLNATQAAREICDVYRDGAVADRTVRKWFARFRDGNFNLEDEERPGRPCATDEDQLRAQLGANPRQTTRELAEVLNLSKSTIHEHLRKLGYVSRYDVWVPHNLSERNLLDRVSICDMLLKRNTNEPFLRRLVTGDEKWIVYDNVVRKRSWLQRGDPPVATPKAGLHPKKIMLSVWWDCKGVLHYALLPNNQTINSDTYCSQLDVLQAAIKKKRPVLANRTGVVFQQDNARPHVSLRTRQKLLEFGWDVLPHPAYSPDIAPSDYHLFRSLQNSLNGTRFDSVDQVKHHLDQFFALKPVKFWEDGIFSLQDRWQKVVQQQGTYICD